MGMETCSYCSGSGRDAINPTHQSCYKCHGIGTYWVPDPIKSSVPGSSSSSGGASSSGGGRQYQMLPWMQRALDSIPGWLNVLCAVIGSGAGVVLAQTTDSPTNGSMAIFAGVGFFVGLGFFRLTIILLDLCIQFTFVLIKIALVVAIFGGIIYGVIKFIGN